MKINKFTEEVIKELISEEDENIFVSKSVISNWLKNKSNQKLLEISIATWPSFGKPVDDGPGLFLKDLDTYKGINAERAAKLGWHIISHLANDTVEDYNELRNIGYVTNFEIGVPERRTETDRYNMMSGKSYNDWLDGVTDSMALVGYSVLQDKYAQKELELQKKLVKKDILTHSETITTQELEEIKNNLIEAMIGISIDAGEPNPSYTPDGLLRLLDRGKPEPWFKQLGYTQVDKPRASFMRGRLKKDQPPELQTRKVSYKVKNVKTSTLKPALKPVGSTEWVPANPDENMDKFKKRKSKNKPKLKEDLRKWLGSGPTGGWDRYSTTGEKLGKCGDAKEGEPYSVCLSNEKARKLGKKGIASFVRRKRDAQKKAGDAKKGGEQKKGQKPVFVKTGVNERLEEVMSLFLEKNEPTNPKKWSYAITQAKKRFDVYPSAYANAWAAKKYKELGGKWKTAESHTLTEIPYSDLKQIDQFADKQLSPLDIVITDKHFFDRLNDPRNDKPISSAELVGFFKRLSKNKKKFIQFLKQYGQIVAKDNRTNINIPFMNVANRVIAKTVMRKSDFKSSNPKFAFEGLFTTDNALKPYEKLLIGSIIEFMRGKYGISSKIIVKKKQSRGLFGDIVLNDNTLNKDKFYLHFNPNQSYSFIIESIIHELIHVKQISKGELRPSSDYKELLWKGKPAISVSDYKKFQRKDYNEYKKLPWEAEAYNGMKPLYREFLKSKQLQSLKGKDENLDYIISNLTENLMMGYPDQKWIDDHNKELKRLRTKFNDNEDDYYTPIDEDITLDVNIGDTILMGKFKNKKVVVKSIGTDEHGMPTINGKKVVNFRKLLNNTYETEKKGLTEVILWETFKIVNESGTFTSVEPIPTSIVDDLLKDFLKKLVIPTKSIDVKSIIGIGSTRSILNKLPNAKKVAGDLDLLAISTEDIKTSVNALVTAAKAKKIEHLVSFGNVTSFAWPYDGKFYQIDLMLSERSPNDNVYNYMAKFKYWSDEDPNQSRPFLIKGAHRSQLVKTLVKAVGLSAAQTDFEVFKWNDEFTDTNQLADILEKSAQKFKDPIKKQQTLDIVSILRNKIKDIPRLKNILADSDGFIKNRFPHSIFRNYDKAWDVLIDKLFVKVKTGEDWDKVMDKKFKLSNSIDRMKTFDDALEFVDNLLKRKIITPRSAIEVFRDLRDKFDNKREQHLWTKELELFIEKKFPFLVGRW